MARPKRDERGPSAQGRIETAFWELLAEMPYDSITITALARRAGVNHNTIYYYYESMDDLALKLFARNIPERILEIFSTVLVSGPGHLRRHLEDPDIFQRWKRLCLFSRSGSPFLFQHLKKMLLETWCGVLEVRQEDLTREQRLDLEFIFSGMVTVLGLAFEENDPWRVTALMERPLGQGILAALAAIGERGETENPQTIRTG